MVPSQAPGMDAAPINQKAILLWLISKGRDGNSLVFRRIISIMSSFSYICILLKTCLTVLFVWSKYFTMKNIGVFLTLSKRNVFRIEISCVYNLISILFLFIYYYLFLLDLTKANLLTTSFRTSSFILKLLWVLAMDLTNSVCWWAENVIL